MDHQPYITSRERSILIDWLVEQHSGYGLRNETLFLTVNIIDRYLEKYVVTKSTIQVLGVTAMLIAAKYGDVYYPKVKDCVDMTDNSCT